MKRRYKNMSSQRSVTVYSFDELSDAAKKKALNHFRDVEIEGNWWSEGRIDMFLEDMLAKGIDILKRSDVQYSGFWSQGDGASFSADINIPKFVKAHKKDLRKHLYALGCIDLGNSSLGVKVSRGHYVHDKMMVLTDDVSLKDEMDSESNGAQVNEFLDDVLDILRNYAKKLYYDLEKDYEEATSDASVKEWIVENNIEFLEDGSTPRI